MHSSCLRSPESSFAVRPSQASPAVTLVVFPCPCGRTAARQRWPRFEMPGADGPSWSRRPVSRNTSRRSDFQRVGISNIASRRAATVRALLSSAAFADKPFLIRRSRRSKICHTAPVETTGRALSQICSACSWRGPGFEQRLGTPSLWGAHGQLLQWHGAFLAEPIRLVTAIPCFWPVLFPSDGAIFKTVAGRTRDAKALSSTTTPN